MQTKIKKLKEKLALEQEKLSFDLLAKSLASYPFAYKDVFSILKAEESYKIFPLIKEEKNIAQLANSLNENYKAGFIESEDLEVLSLARRYSSLALIYSDLIIDKYQILSALLYGANALILQANILEKKVLSDFIAFIGELGLFAVVEIQNYDDLKKAIFSRADIFYLDEEKNDEKSLLKLLNSIPNNKVILMKSRNEANYDFWHNKGIDSFISEKF